MAKKSIPHRNVLIILGVLWFGVFFIFIHFGYPIAVIMLSKLISNTAIAQGIVDMFLLVASVLALIKAMKKVYMITKKKVA